MMIIESRVIDNHQNVIIHRDGADSIKLSIDTKYSDNPREFLKMVWNDVYNMFMNGLNEDEIANLITVNVIGYRKSSKQLDVRYSMALHNRCRSVTLLNNTHFYIDSSLIGNCFDIGIESCINDFNKLRSELSPDFYVELNAMINRI